MSSVQDQVQKSLKLVGRVLGDKFKLTACIGIGGSGAVYKADQIALGRTVAVKILNEELCADSRMISPICPVNTKLPFPLIRSASMKRTSPPTAVHANPVATPI